MIRALDEFDEADVELHRQLLDRFQEAVALALALERCPRWRRRKRRALERDYQRACRGADLVKILLGARPGFPPLDQIIHEQMEGP